MTADDRRLAAAITRWLSDHGHANPLAGASELMHMVRGHGWRPTEALATTPKTGEPSEPNDAWQQAKAEIERRFGR